MCPACSGTNCSYLCCCEPCRKQGQDAGPSNSWHAQVHDVAHVYQQVLRCGVFVATSAFEHNACMRAYIQATGSETHRAIGGLATQAMRAALNPHQQLPWNPNPLCPYSLPDR